MKTISLQLVRKDDIKVELDPEFFNEAWFEDFREEFYDFDELEELAEHIAYNVVHNRANFIDGIGVPLRDGKPYCLDKGDEEHINKHVNIIFNPYDTEVEYG